MRRRISEQRAAQSKHMPSLQQPTCAASCHPPIARTLWLLISPASALVTLPPGKAIDRILEGARGRNSLDVVEPGMRSSIGDIDPE